MTDTPNSDNPGLVVVGPKHCLDCFQLIRPGESCYPGRGGRVLCPMCVSDLLIVTHPTPGLPSRLEADPDCWKED
jgi:hypothetical protein